jgi:hypothetical protein
VKNKKSKNRRKETEEKIMTNKISGGNHNANIRTIEKYN